MTEALKGAQCNETEKITIAAVDAAYIKNDEEKICIKELIETFVKILMKPRPPVFVEIPVPGWPTWPDEREATAWYDSGSAWPSWSPSAPPAPTSSQAPPMEEDTEELQAHTTAKQQQSETPGLPLSAPPGLAAPRKAAAQRGPQQREVIKIKNKFEALATLPKQKFRRTIREKRPEFYELHPAKERKAAPATAAPTTRVKKSQASRENKGGEEEKFRRCPARAAPWDLWAALAGRRPRYQCQRGDGRGDRRAAKS